jgi:hypothetical protein
LRDLGDSYIDSKRSLSQREFCEIENISRSKFFSLKKRGLGPALLNIDGLIRITPKAREAWHKRLAKLAKSKAAHLEAERRRKLAEIAGRIAAASPKHISKRHR